MGNEGFGLTIFLNGIILTPLFFMVGGVLGIIFLWTLIWFIINRHLNTYYRSPSIIKKNIHNKIYIFSKNIVNKIPGRELTEEERKYNTIRMIVYEIANQTAIKDNRTIITKHDYYIGSQTVMQRETGIDNFGIYLKGYGINERVYIIKFDDHYINTEPNLLTEAYINRRFLYQD